jgi:hypothetical protein
MASAVPLPLDGGGLEWGERYVTIASLWRHVSTFPEFDGKNRSVFLADFSHSYSGNSAIKAIGVRCCSPVVKFPSRGKNNAAHE